MGGWMKSNPIPPEYSTWGSFTALADKNQQGLRQILEASAKADAPAGSNERKIGDFYSGCMDTAAIDAAGTKPIDALLLRISLMNSITDLQATAARLQQQGFGVLFRFTSNQDAKDSTQVIATALQGGLGLPERDYYLRIDEKSKKLRDDYAAHIAKMLELLGDSPEKATAAAAGPVRGRSSRAGSAACKAGTATWARRSASSTCKNISRRTPKRTPSKWCTTWSLRCATICRRCLGWAGRPARKPPPSSKPL